MTVRSAARWPFLAVLLLASAAAAQRGASIRVVPDRLDLDEWAAGGTTRGRAWLINTGSRPLHLERIEADGEGIALPGFRPRPIPAGTALPIEVALTAPDEEDVRRVRTLLFVFHEGPSTRLTAAVTAVHPDILLPEPWLDEPAGTTLRAAPTAVHLGDAAPGERGRGSVWLINTGAEPVRVAAAKASCACLEIDFAPAVIDPGEAREVPLEMVSEGLIGQQRIKYVTFIPDGQAPLTTTVSVTVVDPRVSVVRRWLAARDGGDNALARAFLAVEFDAARSIGPGPGTGRLLDPDGRGAWAAWDIALGARTDYDRVEMTGDTIVGVRARHVNDLDALLGRPPREIMLRLEINDEREIARVGVMGPLPDSGPWTKFVAWLARERPDDLAALLPDRAAAPRVADVDRWRELAAVWEQAGRPVRY